jgi:hypothetical protein
MSNDLSAYLDDVLNMDVESDAELLRRLDEVVEHLRLHGKPEITRERLIRLSVQSWLDLFGRHFTGDQS